MSEIDQLVKMANQIAANFSFHEDAVDRLADHLHRFWAPVMIKQLSERVANDSSGIDQAVLNAINKLRLSNSGKPVSPGI
jgi:hypothetical protein